MYAESTVAFIQTTKELFVALKAVATPRFQKSRQARLAKIEEALSKIREDLKTAMGSRIGAVLLAFLKSVPSDVSTKAAAWSEISVLEKLVAMMAVPLEEVKANTIMPEKELQDLKDWWHACSKFIAKLKATMVVAPVNGPIKLDDDNLLAIIGCDSLPLILDVAEDVKQQWADFHKAFCEKIRELTARQLSEVFPREMVPLAEAATKATTLAAWGDLLQAAAVSCSADSLACLRKLVDAVLQIRTCFNTSSTASWTAQVQRVQKETTHVVTVTLSIDALLVSVYLAFFHAELHTIFKVELGLKEWEKKTTMNERREIMKDFAEAVTAFKCVHSTSLPQVGEFCSRWPSSESSTGVARSTGTFFFDACKSLTDDKFTHVFSQFNTMLRMAKKSLQHQLGEVSSMDFNMIGELEKLSADGGAFDDDLLKKFMKVGQSPSAKMLYQQFRFWNEAIVNVYASMKEVSGSNPIESWDDDENVKEAGMLSGSMTLLQCLAVPDLEQRANTLSKAVKGLAVLGRGLMQGHPAVLARVNKTLAAAAAAAAQPAAKKAKTTV